jgi:hypothetical protein
MTLDEADTAEVARSLRRKRLAAEFIKRQSLPELVRLGVVSLGARDFWTYFLQGDDGGPIKIGSTRSDPHLRAASLQTGYPFGRLRVVGLINGPQRLERELHKRFRALQMIGEWFRAAPELLAFIAALPSAQVGPRSREINGLG